MGTSQSILKPLGLVTFLWDPYNPMLSHCYHGICANIRCTESATASAPDRNVYIAAVYVGKSSTATAAFRSRRYKTPTVHLRY